MLTPSAVDPAEDGGGACAESGAGDAGREAGTITVRTADAGRAVTAVAAVAGRSVVECASWNASPSAATTAAPAAAATATGHLARRGAGSGTKISLLLIAFGAPDDGGAGTGRAAEACGPLPGREGLALSNAKLSLAYSRGALPVRSAAALVPRARASCRCSARSPRCSLTKRATSEELVSRPA